MRVTAERYLSLQEVGDELGVSDQTVRRWVKAGELAAYKPGKEYRIKGSDLEEFLQTREVGPKGQAPLPLENGPAGPQRREDRYQPWLEFANRYADRWEEKIAAGGLDVRSFNEFLATLEDVMATLRELNKEEKRSLPEPEMYTTFGDPDAKTGVAINRLLGIIDPMAEAWATMDESSEFLEKLRQKRAEYEERTAEGETA